VNVVDAERDCVEEEEEEEEEKKEEFKSKAVNEVEAVEYRPLISSTTRRASHPYPRRSRSRRQKTRIEWRRRGGAGVPANALSEVQSLLN
jgi:hypothetical protein